MNNATLRKNNRCMVLKMICTGKASSRIELAELSGLTKMSITNIVDQLISEQFIEEKEAAKGDKIGRPRKTLAIARKAPKLISVYLSEDTIVVSMTDFMLSILRTKKEETQPISDTISTIASISASIDEFLRSSINESIFGIGIAVKPGCIFDIDGIANIISEKYKLPVYTENVDCCSLIAESIYGNCSSDDESLFLNISSTLTAASITNAPLNDCMIRQPNFGHISIDYNGLPCHCGNKGCIETYVSTTAMEKKLKEMTKMKIDFKGFCDLQSKKNDSRIDWALKDMTDKLAVAIINYSNLFFPSKIIIGGEGFYLPDRYIIKLEKAVNDKAINTKKQLSITKPRFKNDGYVIGGAALLLSKIFENSF